MKMANSSKSFSLGIPAFDYADGADIRAINDSAFSILRKKKVADFTLYGIPTVGDDVFSRKVRLVKLLKKDALGPIDNIPDLDDIHYTDLPWIGQTTFSQASRQFRSKNILACAVDVVREFEGFLYRLSVWTDLDAHAITPVLVLLDRASKNELHHTLTINREVTKQEYDYYLLDAPKVPNTLRTEMAKLGYVLYSNGKDYLFKLSGPTRPGTDIRVELFGKVLMSS